MEVAMIRLATAADAKAMSEIYGPIVAETPISFELVPPTESEMAGRIVSGLAYAPWLACVQGADVAGFAYASRHRERAAYQWSVDVSVYVHERFRRHGVGRGLYTSLFALLRVQCICAAHAGITLPNAGSVGLHEAMGFRPVGVYPGVGYKCRAWHDVGWWQLALAARVEDPPRPLTCAEAQADPDWSRALTAGLPLLRF
jgi:L-amino acid N-acyltransferase YncA